MPPHPVRRRFWLECCLAALTGFLAVATIVWPDWIELVLGIDPDRGSGTVEVVAATVLALATVVFAVVSRLEWQRGLRPAAVSDQAP